jgi:hypothetical protein
VRLAILKIDDAVYLKPGQSAWLVRTGDADGKVAWRLDPKKGALLDVSYAGDRIEMAGKSYAAVEGAALNLNPDIDVRVQETQIAPGQIGVRLFAYNQKNPAAKAFTGLSYFPYSPGYAISASFTPEAPTPVDFETSRGWLKRFWRVGLASFTVNGVQTRLPLYADDPKPKDSLSAFFTDDTTGVSTYGVGRYVDAAFEGPFPPKTITIDFNFAYNPNCARTPHYNCPYATDRIATAIEVGEKAPPPH